MINLRSCLFALVALSLHVNGQQVRLNAPIGQFEILGDSLVSGQQVSLRGTSVRRPVFIRVFLGIPRYFGQNIRC